MANCLAFDDPETNSEDESVEWQKTLQSYRLHITVYVEYWKISPYLKAYGIFDQDDDEEAKNPAINPTNSRKMNAVVDKLLRKGKENYDKFLDVLKRTNRDIYNKITGEKDGAIQSPICIPPPDQPPGDIHFFLEFVLEKYEQKRGDCEQMRKQLTMSSRDAEEKEREISQLQVTLKELKKRNERYESMERDNTALKDVLDQVKNENYKNCMRLLDATEENARLRERNMAMRIEMDKKENDLKKANRVVDSERKASFRLKRRIQEGPSQKYVSTLLKEIEELKIQLAQSKKSSFSVDGDIDTKIQILQSDKEEAFQMYAEASEKLNKLREEFNDTEAVRDKYLEENERLGLQLAALTDDCDMFRNRRDAVWQQLQEVEKERDQLMKERNEAQMSAQNHMDEKTKYRAEIRNLEENLDNKSMLLREKEKEILEIQKELKQTNKPLIDNGEDIPSRGSLETSSTNSLEYRPRAHNIKYYSEFNVQSEFDGIMESQNTEIGVDGEFPEISLAKDYGKNCGKPLENSSAKKRNAIRRGGVKSGKLNRSHETQSRTSSTDSEKQRTSSETRLIMVEIEATAVQECVRFTGGNKSGIFIQGVLQSQNSAYVGSLLRPGLKLLKIRKPQAQPYEVLNWTLEYTYDFIKSLKGILVLILESKPTEIGEVKDESEPFKVIGDSFYIRANFAWREEEMMVFEKFEIMHVVSTEPFSEMNWQACKVDPYNGHDAAKPGAIPSLKYSLKHPLQIEATPKVRAMSEPSFSFPPDFKDMRYQRKSCNVNSSKQGLTSYVLESIATGNVRNPYTAMKPVVLAKNMPRPCLFLPQNLTDRLIANLASKTKPLVFDFPPTETMVCAVNEVRSKLYDRDLVSYKTISENTHEVVSTISIKNMMREGKYGLLSINENGISIKEYLTLLHEEDIYPIVIVVRVENKKAVK